MQVNNTQVVDRSNRPNVSQRVGLRTFFINDGAYVDPYAISGVSIFRRSSTLSPNTVLGSEGTVTSVPLMQYGASGAVLTSDDNFLPSNYIPSVTASGIYRLGVGDYVVVLDQTLSLSGWDATNATTVCVSGLSSVDTYMDLWSVQLNSASKYQVISNQFTLWEDSFFSFTEPLLLTTTNKLMNKHVRLGERIELKVGTETTIQNKNIPESVQNIWKNSVINNAQMEIKKVNQDLTFDGPFTVLSFALSQPTITEDNTIIINWDTTTIKNLTSFGDGTFGSLTGTYSVQVKYDLLTETIISPLFYLTVS